MSDIVKRLRLLEADHPPDGWPAVQMRDITALLDALDRLTAANRTLRNAQKACETCAPDMAALNRKLVRVLEAAVAEVCNPAWAGVCDESVALERVLRDCGFIE